VKTAFRRLLGVLPAKGLVVAGADSPRVAEVLEGTRSRVVTFGIERDADWRASQVRVDGEGTRFRVSFRGQDHGEFALRLLGEHNVRNALAALAVAAEAGVPPDAARPSLAAFGGVKRRLERRGTARGVTVWDDFAHHPTAVRETLRALRTLGAGRVVAVFEPRSYTSRTRVFQEEFARALALADRVVVSAAHLPVKVPEGQRICEPELARAVAADESRSAYVPRVDDIVGRLAAEAREGDQIVVLSNGGFGEIHTRLLAALSAAPGGARTFASGS
jgi:UDP-N-acetylmuramate: L-alanyl-gamma-D-glutamyl-meso-diaminopimelate ligase